MPLFPCRSECRNTVGKKDKKKWDSCLKDCRDKKKGTSDPEFDKALSILGQPDTSSQGGGNTGLIIGAIVFVVIVVVVLILMKRKKGKTA